MSSIGFHSGQNGDFMDGDQNSAKNRQDISEKRTRPSPFSGGFLAAVVLELKNDLKLKSIEIAQILTWISPLFFWDPKLVPLHSQNITVKSRETAEKAPANRVHGRIAPKQRAYVANDVPLRSCARRNYVGGALLSRFRHVKRK